MGMRRDDCERLLEELQSGEMSPDQMYGVIHELGRNGCRSARAAIESFLRSEDVELRYIALEALAQHFRLQEHWQTAIDFLERDPTSRCRIIGASSLGVLKRNTGDLLTVRVLAGAVANRAEQDTVRQAAYSAMREVLRYDPQEQLTLAVKSLDLERDVDWRLVMRYLRDA